MNMRTVAQSILLDTDIGSDCDDAAALALTVLYARSEGAHLIGVTHCTSSKWGVGAIRAILDWYGAENVPVGTLMDEGFLDAENLEIYNRALAMRVDESARVGVDAQRLYREVLAAQPDQSVDIIAIGPMRNLGNLISSSDGLELVTRKVRRLILMAGNFAEETPEYNIKIDITSAQRVAELWPGEIVYCGWEVGAPVVAIKEPSPLKQDNPVRIAYQLHSHGAGRSSWDLCTVQWALNSECPYYNLSARGTIVINEIGVTHWYPTSDGKHFYLSLSEDPQIIANAFQVTLAAFDAIS